MKEDQIESKFVHEHPGITVFKSVQMICPDFLGWRTTLFQWSEVLGLSTRDDWKEEYSFPSGLLFNIRSLAIVWALVFVLN